MSLGFDRDEMYEKRLLEQEPKQTRFQGQDAIRKINDAIKRASIPEEQPRTFALDFDGVLFHHEPDWPIGKIGEPLEPGIKMAKRIKAAGHRLIVLTARPQQYHKSMEDALKGQGVRADQVTNVKPPAEVYVDDRAVHWPKNYAGQSHMFTAREHGTKGMKWGVQQGKTATVYHGTSMKRAKGILRKGIRRNYPKNFNISAKGYVYVTTGRENAKSYAVTVGGWRAAVIALEIPKSALKNFERDPEKKGPFGSSNKLALRFSGDIPKSAIKWVEYRKPNTAGWKARRVTIREAAGDKETVTLFMPYFGDLRQFGIDRQDKISSFGKKKESLFLEHGVMGQKWHHHKAKTEATGNRLGKSDAKAWVKKCLSEYNEELEKRKGTTKAIETGPKITSQKAALDLVKDFEKRYGLTKLQGRSDPERLVGIDKLIDKFQYKIRDGLDDQGKVSSQAQSILTSAAYKFSDEEGKRHGSGWNPEENPRQEMFAKAGFDGKSYENFAESMHDWFSDQMKDIQHGAEEIRSGKVSSDIGRGLLLENAINRVFYGSGEMTMYRGVSGKYAHEMYKAQEAGEKSVAVKLAGANSYTTSKSVAEGYSTNTSSEAHHYGAVLVTKIDPKDILISHRTFKERGGSEEGMEDKEIVVLARNPRETLRFGKEIHVRDTTGAD